LKIERNRRFLLGFLNLSHSGQSSDLSKTSTLWGLEKSFGIEKKTRIPFQNILQKRRAKSGQDNGITVSLTTRSEAQIISKGNSAKGTVQSTE
jgi:hypothetical protein